MCGHELITKLNLIKTLCLPVNWSWISSLFHMIKIIRSFLVQIYSLFFEFKPSLNYSSGFGLRVSHGFKVFSGLPWFSEPTYKPFWNLAKNRKMDFRKSGLAIKTSKNRTKNQKPKPKISSNRPSESHNL